MKGAVMRMGVVVLLIVILMLASPVLAETRGIGLSAGVMDGDFAVQLGKDFRLGGDISQISGGFEVCFQNKTTFRVDADYHFVIKSGEGRFYPLAGVQFAFTSKNAEFGINAGGGVNFMFTESLAGFAEGKWVFSDWDGLAVYAGIYF